jgi:predicted RNA-binding Zn-ribbon protein involved in translation (DUF1610 family)
MVEMAVERYRFTCSNCGHTWTADYDVQYLEDPSGDAWAFYRLDGVPVIAPTQDVHVCPVCGRGRVWVDLMARRDVPFARLDSDQPRTKVTGRRRAAVPPPPATERSKT